MTDFDLCTFNSKVFPAIACAFGMALSGNSMSEHSTHLAMGTMAGPDNTLPMMMGQGPHGPIEVGGMFTVLKCAMCRYPAGGAT